MAKKITMKEHLNVILSLVSAALQDEKSQHTAGEDEGGNNEDDEEINDATIQENLSSSFLTIELAKSFKQLFIVRKEIILVSHLENHAMEDFDISAADIDVDAIPRKTVDSLNLSRRVDSTMVDHLCLILKGIRKKRAARKPGEKVCVSDDTYRENFLSFLKICWEKSGAEGRENALENSAEKLNTISSMETAVAKVISRFIFLDYMCCISSEEGK